MWGRLLLSLFWCGCGAFSWGTCGFLQHVLQLATLLGFHTHSCLRLAGLLLQWTFMGGLAVSWCTTSFSTLCRRSFPFRCLPLAGSAPLSGSSSLVYSCGGALLLGWRCLVTPLGFLPCACAAPPSAACAAPPSAAYP